VRGSGYLDCLAPSIAFAPGGYVVITSLTDTSTQHVYDQVRDSARFNVDSGDQQWWGGYIHTPSRWLAPDRARETS
jgi:ABC-2 type transport system ATP-binding protein